VEVLREESAGGLGGGGSRGSTSAAKNNSAKGEKVITAKGKAKKGIGADEEGNEQDEKLALSSYEDSLA